MTRCVSNGRKIPTMNLLNLKATLELKSLLLQEPCHEKTCFLLKLTKAQISFGVTVQPISASVFAT